MGCNGCELWPTMPQIITTLVRLITRFSDIPRDQIRSHVVSLINEYEAPSEVTRDAEELIQRLRKQFVTVPADKLLEAVKGLFRCYAGILTMRWGGRSAQDISVKERGYPPVFEKTTKFPGRMAKTARAANLHGTDRPDKPWLNGCARLIFVSDMGDALSKEIDFDYLKTEIIDVVKSEKGSRHIWLWLTKRPARMAEFSDWLKSHHDQPWPDNLVAMASVTNKATRTRINELRRVPAKLRGLSVEPLVEPVELNLTEIDWLIVGGESGDYARDFDLEWARSLRDQCRSAGTAFFVKQLGASAIEDGFPHDLVDSHGSDWDEWPEDLRIREVPQAFKSYSHLLCAADQSSSLQARKA